MQVQQQNQIQSLIHTTFSCISYLRDLLDDSCFEDQTLGTSKIKKIIRTKESNALLNLLQGMNEAVMHNYLDKFEVALYLDKDKSQEIHESYTFEVNYEEDEDVEEKQSMIKSFCLVLQRLKPLPPDKFVTIKLYYNEQSLQIIIQWGSKTGHHTRLRTTKKRLILSVA